MVEFESWVVKALYRKFGIIPAGTKNQKEVRIVGKPKSETIENPRDMCDRFLSCTAHGCWERCAEYEKWIVWNWKKFRREFTAVRKAPAKADTWKYYAPYLVSGRG